MKIPEILKTFTYKCLFEILGFEIKPVLVCLGPILGCRDVPWACLQPVLGLSEAFRGRSWAVWRESGGCLFLSGHVWRLSWPWVRISSGLKSRKPFINKWSFNVFGLKSKPVLACLGPVLGCAGPVLGCLVLSWAVMEPSWNCPGPVSASLDLSEDCRGFEISWET